jgi:CheY-like chemotaxis protein
MMLLQRASSRPGSASRKKEAAVRVLLATARPSLGAALSLFLSERGVEVVGVVSRAQEVRARITAARADVLIVDWHLVADDTADVVADLKADPDAVPVVVLTSSQDPAPDNVPAADAFATLGDPPEALLAVLLEVAPTLAPHRSEGAR